MDPDSCLPFQAVHQVPREETRNHRIHPRPRFPLQVQHTMVSDAPKRNMGCGLSGLDSALSSPAGVLAVPGHPRQRGRTQYHNYIGKEAFVTVVAPRRQLPICFWRILLPSDHLWLSVGKTLGFKRKQLKCTDYHLSTRREILLPA